MDNAPNLRGGRPHAQLATQPAPSTPARRAPMERRPPALPLDARAESEEREHAERDAIAGEPLGGVIADVVDAFGDTVRTRLELVEEKVISRARTAGLRSLGAGAAAVLMLAAWVCGAVALGLWLREPLNGPAALGIIAAIHVVAAAAVAVTVGIVGRRREEA